jgi:multidrug efflux pump subunit AcrA (membrane-fusion protein)
LSVAGVPKELLGPDIQAAVLQEARVLLERAQSTCQQLLKANRAQLDALAQRLLEREVVSGDELKGLLGARVNTLNHGSILDAGDDPYSPHSTDTADRAAGSMR